MELSTHPNNTLYPLEAIVQIPATMKLDPRLKRIEVALENESCKLHRTKGNSGRFPFMQQNIEKKKRRIYLEHDIHLHK